VPEKKHGQAPEGRRAHKEAPTGGGPAGETRRHPLRERCEYLRSVARLKVSESTLSRLLRRLGWTRKKDRWERANATSS
jgi:transposase